MMHLAGTMEHCGYKSSDILRTRITKQITAKETQQSVIALSHSFVGCFATTQNFNKWSG